MLTHLGATKLPASTSRQPASTNFLINSTFNSVESSSFSFCNPSRGPTSTILIGFRFEEEESDLSEWGRRKGERGGRGEEREALRSVLVVVLARRSISLRREGGREEVNSQAGIRYYLAAEFEPQA